MKKTVLTAALAVLTALAIIACGKKESTNTSGPTIEGETQTITQTLADGRTVTIVMPATTPEETNPENGLPLSKQPDPNAPVLASIVIYGPNEDGSKVVSFMEAAEEMTPEGIVELLIQGGTLAEGAGFVSVEESDSEETVAAGPGASSSGTVKNATVTISGFAPGEKLSEEAAKQAVIDTFRENYSYGEVTLVLQ